MQNKNLKVVHCFSRSEATLNERVKQRSHSAERIWRERSLVLEGTEPSPWNIFKKWGLLYTWILSLWRLKGLISEIAIVKTNDDGDVQCGFNSKNIFKRMQFNGKWEIYGSTLCPQRGEWGENSFSFLSYNMFNKQVHFKLI